jgi:hypothetical protein
MIQRVRIADCCPKTCTEAHAVVTYSKVIVATTFPFVNFMRNKKAQQWGFAVNQ